MIFRLCSLSNFFIKPPLPPVFKCLFGQTINYYKDKLSIIGGVIPIANTQNNVLTPPLPTFYEKIPSDRGYIRSIWGVFPTQPPNPPN